MKINKNDKTLIKAYCKWAANKGFWPGEYQVSQLIDNMIHNHRYLVEDYLNELKEKYEVEWNQIY